jgi:hypothetical protein
MRRRLLQPAQTVR